MVYNGVIKGRYVTLRSATEDDAESTLALRLDERLSVFLHKVDNDIEKQREWIRKQRDKDDDLFFVVEDKNKKVIGMMGIYEIKRPRAHVGRLLMSGSAIESFEAYLLLFSFAFGEFGLEEIYGETDIKNQKAMRFSKMFGYKYGEPVYDPVMDGFISWATLTKEDYPQYAKRIEKMIYR